MTRREIRELLEDLRKYFIKAEVKDWRVKLTEGENHAREHYESLIASDEEIESMILYELARQDADLWYEVEERASIMCTEGAPYDLLEAVRVKLRVAIMNEAEGQIPACGEMPL